MRRKLAKSMRPNPSTIPSYAQYAMAVSMFDHGKGEASWGEVIHRTPKAKRSEYARRIAGNKRARGTDRRSEVPF
jgi:hypothetical protein